MDRRRLVALSALVLALSACEARLALGTACTRSAECGAPLVCRFERCRAECTETRDCPLGAACIRDGSAGVCRLPEETSCTEGGCPGALVCASGVCRNRCRSDEDCAGRCLADPVAGTVCIEPEGRADAGPALDAPTEIVVPVARDLDDGFIRPGEALFSSGEGFTDYAGSITFGPVRSYFRFALPVAIPAGVSIEDARLELWGTDLYDGGGVCQASYRLGIVADDVADATEVTTLDDWPDGPSGAPATAASVAWSFVGSWAIDGVNVSPDLSPILAELLERHGGLAAGAHVQLWSWALDFGGECAAGIEDWASIASHPAVLRVRLRG